MVSYLSRWAIKRNLWINIANGLDLAWVTPMLMVINLD